MGVKKWVLFILLTIESWFLRLFPIQKKRITLISLDSNRLSMDFELIYNALDKNKYDVQLCLIDYDKNLKGQFLYFLNCFQQLYYIYTSRMVIINNNNYAISHFKRKGVLIFQIWHACGAIKKFGNAIEREYKIANYDYVLSTSSYWKKPYSEAFDVKEESVLPLGMPRNDELFDQSRVCEYKENLYQKYPYLKNKKVILYAPTFRGNIYKGFSTVPFDAVSLLNQLGDEYVLLYKYHPLLGDIQLPTHERIINMNHEDTHQLFCVCDYMVSDYSSIIFDYMILEKPFIFYVPDLKKYEKELGVFVDIETLGLPISKDIQQLYEVIKEDHFDLETIKSCQDIFFDYKDHLSTERIIHFIDEVM